MLVFGQQQQKQQNDNAANFCTRMIKKGMMVNLIAEIERYRNRKTCRIFRTNFLLEDNRVQITNIQDENDVREVRIWELWLENYEYF